jgi:regulator of sigma E protease
MDFADLGGIVLLILGFGFVIFWHELGHFLAAKWAGVKVEQFAVGFGQAIASWRKGLGFRWGSSAKEHERLLREGKQGFDSVDPTSIGETEYRLNWLPLGGYVKMLGQDDLNPHAQSEDPRAYNNKPISKRMVIVSAGVIMNVILAAGLFMVLFLYGFNVPPAVVPTIIPGSPAQQAGLHVGDRILYFNGNYQHDFTKISMNAALSEEGATIPMIVRRADNGKEERLDIATGRDSSEAGFLSLGIAAPGQVPQELRGLDPKKVKAADFEKSGASKALMPGETIVAIEGQPVQVAEYWRMDRALQNSFGRPVNITVKDASGQTQERQVEPVFMDPFGKAPLNFAGMVPRPTVMDTLDASPAKDKLKPGDVIAAVTLQSPPEMIEHPTRDKLMKVLDAAGQSGRAVDVKVLRDGQEETVTGLVPTVKVGKNRMGLGIGLGTDETHAVVADVLPDTVAARANLLPGSTITSIDAQPVRTWFDVHRLLAGAGADQAIAVELTDPSGQKKTIRLTLTAADVQSVASNRYTHRLALREHVEPRKTRNPLTAAAWGVTETRDLLVQFYLTIKRMAQRSVPVSGVMGPVGIVQAGSRFASKGVDWLLWFLAMISANLAVVNFLPIPIVDGGLFVFLLLEKSMGRPLSPRAQSIAQIVGLALILSVFLFVTYQDINRFF